MRRAPLDEILLAILRRPAPVRAIDLAEMFAVSEKTIWNRLRSSACADLLGKQVKLVGRPSVGIALDGSEVALGDLGARLESAQGTGPHADGYRRSRSLIDLLLSRRPLTIRELAGRRKISSNMMASDLDDIGETVRRHDLDLERRPNVGVRVRGDEIAIRQLLENTLLQTSASFKTGHHTDIMFDEGVRSMLEAVNLSGKLMNAVPAVSQIQRQLLGAFTDEGRKEIIVQLLISDSRSRYGNAIERISDDMYEVNARFEQFVGILDANDMRLAREDALYVWRRCMRSRFAASDRKTIDDTYMRLSRDLLRCIVGLRKDTDVEQLIGNLAYHIAQAVERCAAGMFVRNPMLQKIKRQYGGLYAAVAEHVGVLERELSVTFTEDEIGFITIYICAMYEKSLNDRLVRVLLVSDEGIGQIKLITAQITSCFANLLVDQVTDSLRFRNEMLSDCDVVIATCPISVCARNANRFIRVSNFIDQKDIEMISRNLGRLSTPKDGFFRRCAAVGTDLKRFTSSARTIKELVVTYAEVAECFGVCERGYRDSMTRGGEHAVAADGSLLVWGEGAPVRQQTLLAVDCTEPLGWEGHRIETVLLLFVDGTLPAGDALIKRVRTLMSDTDLLRRLDDGRARSRFKQALSEGGED